MLCYDLAVELFVYSGFGVTRGEVMDKHSERGFEFSKSTMALIDGLSIEEAKNYLEGLDCTSSATEAEVEYLRSHILRRQAEMECGCSVAGSVVYIALSLGSIHRGSDHVFAFLGENFFKLNSAERKYLNAWSKEKSSKIPRSKKMHVNLPGCETDIIETEDGEVYVARVLHPSEVPPKNPEGCVKVCDRAVSVKSQEKDLGLPRLPEVSGYQQEMWSVPKDVIYAAIHSIETALAYMPQVKTDVPVWQKVLEQHVLEMKSTLEMLKKLP